MGGGGEGKKVELIPGGYKVQCVEEGSRARIAP